MNDVFSTIQGEGVRAGTANVFVRFGKCNLACRRETHGFDCDTEFESGRLLDLDSLVLAVKAVDTDDCGWIVLTGGEPALQVDDRLIGRLHDVGYRLAIETNGSVELPIGLDWITVSPKVAEHAIRQRTADEVKYVRGYGQEIPHSTVEATHRLISPAFDGDDLDPETLAWCVDLVRRNPDWRLSVQQHKGWAVR